MIGAAVGGVAGAVWADRDNDGRVDGYISNGQYYQGGPSSTQPRLRPIRRRLAAASAANQRPDGITASTGRHRYGVAVTNLRKGCTGRWPVHLFQSLAMAAALGVARRPPLPRPGAAEAASHGARAGQGIDDFYKARGRRAAYGSVQERRRARSSCWLS